MSSTNRQVQSANLLVIQFDGTPVGIVQSARFSGDFGLTDEAGIGDNVVVEYVPGVAHVTVSASGVVLLQQNLLSLGIAPSNSVRDILAGKVIDIGLYSKASSSTTTNGSTSQSTTSANGSSSNSGSWLLKAIDCSIASIDIGVQTARAVTFDASFRARDLAGTLLG